VSLNYLAARFTCSWPWSTLVLLCDGRLVCGCLQHFQRAVVRRGAAWPDKPGRYALKFDLVSEESTGSGPAGPRRVHRQCAGIVRADGLSDSAGNHNSEFHRSIS
jgi:hypothetical protein